MYLSVAFSQKGADHPLVDFTGSETHSAPLFSDPVQSAVNM